MLFDTHAHYDHAEFDADRGELLAGLKDKGVAYVINVGSDAASSERSFELAARYDFIWFAAGIHPHCASKALEASDSSKAPGGFEGAIEELMRRSKAAALGEIGLDYHYGFSPRDCQKEVFARQLALACKLKVPVIIHDREAHDDIIDIARAYRDGLRGGVLHCFSGDRRLAGRALDLGFHIAFGGALTFKNAGAAVDAAAYVPADRLLIETDCPYLSPEPFRGRRNDSGRVGLVAERIAQIRGMGFDEVAGVTAENAKKLFSIT